MSVEKDLDYTISLPRRSRLEAKVKFRCPSCSKLYQTLREDLVSDKPHFDCSVCHAEFTVELGLSSPQGHPEAIASLVKSADLIRSQSPVGAEVPAELKKCPKCEAANLISSAECFSCGVVFAKLNEPRGLDRDWQNLLQDYENPGKHSEFLKQCKKLNAQVFALKKYQDLKSVQPDDEIAQEMITKILRQERLIFWLNKAKAWSKTVNWPRVLKLGAYAVGTICIAIGLMSRSQRNLMSFGVSLIFLATGLIILMRGRVAFRDIWE